MGGVPSIHAGFLQSNLRAVEALGPEVAARVRARIGAARIARIEAAPRLAWLPVELDIAVVEGVEAEAGPLGLRRWLTASVERSAVTALISPFVTGARAVFGLGPHALLRRTPQMWSVMYRECGRPVYHVVSLDATRIVLEGAPPALLGSRAALEQLGAGLEAALAVMNQRATITIEMDGARATFHCTW